VPFRAARGSIGRRGAVLTDRSEVDGLLRELYAARVRSDLDGLCRAFSEDAKFRIAGISQVSPIAVTAVGSAEIRQWLALLLKTFQLSDQLILSMIVENARAAVHWRAKIYSRITGLTVPTELVDLVEVKNGRIASYTEFLAPG
jgi:ketosteroid isomerase-like protein